MRSSSKISNSNQDSGWSWIEKYGWVAAILSFLVPALEKAFPENISKPIYTILIAVCIFVSFYSFFRGFLFSLISRLLGSQWAAVILAGITTVYVLSFTTNSNATSNKIGGNSPTLQTPSVSPTTNPQIPMEIPTPTIPLIPSEVKALSFKQAGDLVWEYLDLKKEIFTPPYNEERLGRFAGGKLYKDVKREIDYIKKNNISFGYKHKLFEQLEDKFSCLEDTCVFIVEEDRESTEYTNGVITKEPSDSSSTIRTYKLQNENGVWKIYDFKEGILTIDDPVWRSY